MEKKAGMHIPLDDKKYITANVFLLLLLREYAYS